MQFKSALVGGDSTLVMQFKSALVGGDSTLVMQFKSALVWNQKRAELETQCRV
jgi:hypothetical protein